MMLDLIYNLLEVVVIAYVLTDLGEFIGDLIQIFNNGKNKLLGVFISLISYLLQCSKCFTFWFSLIFTGDLFIAASAAIIVSQVKEIINMYNGDTKL